MFGDGFIPAHAGKTYARMDARRPIGLIPAHAGKTGSGSSDATRPGAHPRSRGENVKRVLVDWTLAGSSPLTRGKRGPRKPFRDGRGLIPAHAGKTWTASPQLPRTWAHPRSRGENAGPIDAKSSALGSSPLTRGKPRLNGGQCRSRGLIPAHAGKTRGPGRARTRWGAHPRSRGENPGMRSVEMIVEGSSPLTQGKLLKAATSDHHRRLIPAHAGKTCRGSCRAAQPWAHPRSRGENPPGFRVVRVTPGSSPLTRGKRTVVD